MLLVTALARAIGPRTPWCLAWRLAWRHRDVLTGIADQGVIGAGNLAMGLLVLRGSSKEEYGLYGLFYATLILLNGFCNALFVAQLTVAYHGRPDPEGAAAATLCGQVLVTAALGLATAAAALLTPGAALSPALRSLAVVSALAGPALMMQDFMRGYFFIVGRPAAALLLDVALILTWAGGLVILRDTLHLRADVAAIGSLGAAALAAGGAGLLRARLPLRRGRPRALAAVAESWRLGRWALGGALVTALQNQAHLYLLAWLASAAALADLNAARMLVMPMGLLIGGTGRTLLPALARSAAARRPAAMRRTVGRSFAALLAAIAAYAAALALGHGLVGRLLGPGYAQNGGLVALWTCVIALQAATTNLSLLLQACRRFRDLMLVNLWTVAPVLALAVPMIRAFGTEGSLATLAAGYAAMLLLLWRRARAALAALAPAGGAAPSLPAKGP